MPRQQGISIQNNFTKGLITEATALSFPENACTEVDNIVFDPTGRVTRRFGFDEEANSSRLTYSTTDSDVYTTYVWNAVAGSGDTSFLVVQSGSTLRFYDISNSTDVSPNLHITTVVLDTFKVINSTLATNSRACQFSSGNGDLFVTHPSCDSFYVVYDVGAGTLTATAINITIRDFDGLDDGLDTEDRPSDTVGGLVTSNPNHYYNLYNQGWYVNPNGTDALAQWDTARSDLPSNADYIGLYRGSATDPFDNSRVTANSPGNRLAPRGHFIIDAPSLGRQTAMDDTGVTLTLSIDSLTTIDRTAGTTFGNMVRQNKAFDGIYPSTENPNSAATTTGSPGYIGKDFGGSPRTINRAIAWPSTDFIWGSGAGHGDVTISLYASNSLPATATDGTLLATTDVSYNNGNSVTLVSNNATTLYQYIWIYINSSTGVFTSICSEVILYTNVFTLERFSAVEFYAGRVFYAGLGATALSNNIYFSQIIESKDQYGKCYQKNDPTSEFIPDLLSDDGGVIRIPEMGTVKKLYSYQNALLIFANNGIWLISGSSGSSFKADDYVVKKISSIGVVAPTSICSIKGLPAWWGEDGIYTVTFDPNYDSFTPVSLTLNILDSFYNSIPAVNKKYAKGTYDETNQIAYWLYNSGTLTNDLYNYDSVLCLDGKSKAFYTWTIGTGPVVRSIDYIKSAMRTSDPKLKFLINPSYDGTVLFSSTQTFAEVTSTAYKDWVNEGHNVDYTSYFITGYRLDGQTQKFFQPNYVFVFLEQETNASCFMQAIFDFTTSGDTGKWSSSQQVVKDFNINRSVNFRRLKIRGKGRAVQLRFESETGKPFTIIGWSMSESSNTGV